MSGLLLLGLAWICTSTAAAVVATLRLRAPPPPAGPAPLPGPTTGPPALLLRPCAGDEPGLAARLSRPPAGAWPLHTRFVLASADDPALPAATAAVAALHAAGQPADLHIVPPLGPNRKASQLHGGLQAPLPTGAPTLVASVDSDVDLASVDLAPLLAPLVAPGGPAATWAPPVEVAPRTVGDRASQAVLGGSLHAFPLLRGVDPTGLVGKCFAVRGDALAQAGGFLALVEHLGEDMELSRRLRGAGLRVAPVGLRVPSQVGGRTTGEVVARLARWLRVIRAQRPALLASYPLVLAPLPGQLLLAALLGSPALALAAIGGRLLVALLARRACALPLGGAFLDTLIADPLLLWAWRAALGSRTFRWRGVPLRIGAGGRLETVP
ncbi:hypothetical protein L6R53_22885 [Myxococcota bacterium]|nr:hypothetical protein [Myxococcota bacterium]